MQVCKLIWWKHADKIPQYSSAKVHGSLKIELKNNCKKPKSIEDYDIKIIELDGLNPEIYNMV